MWRRHALKLGLFGGSAFYPFDLEDALYITKRHQKATLIKSYVITVHDRASPALLLKCEWMSSFPMNWIPITITGWRLLSIAHAVQQRWFLISRSHFCSASWRANSHFA